MNFELTNESLQDLAVKCVTEFMNKQASLSEAIAKQAMDLELNPEQTRRVIEASNTIAYLRQLEKSADRTFEFDVADYNHVMAHMCIPDMDKTAGELPPWLKAKDEDKKESKGEDKKESKDEDKKESKDEDKKESKDEDKKESKDEDKKESDDPEADEREKKAMLNKAYFVAKANLEKMAYDESIIYMELDKQATLVSKDPFGNEKIAFVVEEQDAPKLLKLCGLEKAAEANSVFLDLELKNARELYSLYKQACSFLEEKAALEDFVKRAEQVLFHKTANVEKLAFVTAMAGGLAKGLGTVIGKSVGLAGRGVGSTVKNFGAFGRAAKANNFGSTDEAVKAFDKIKKTEGTAAAKAKFAGSKPNVLVHRVGIGGALTATTGLSVEHANNVKDI
jgi:hypothetical protein